jgi:signal transduction histidine kinase
MEAAKPMVKIINARTAGYRLAWIVAVLLLPIIYMGTTIFEGLRKEEADIHTELQGAAYLNMLLPVMLDAAGYHVRSAALKEEMKDSSALSQSMGLGAENNNLLTSLSYASPNQHAVLKQSMELAQRTGLNSGSIFDARPESYHLAVTISEYLPRVLYDFQHLRSVVMDAANHENDHNDNLINLAIGNLSSSTARFQASAVEASLSSGEQGFYRDVLQRADDMQRDMNQLSDIGLGMSMGGLKDIKAELIDKINRVTSKWISIFEFDSFQLQRRQNSLLQARANEIDLRIWKILLTSICTVLLGLGSAFAMYRSTLKKLDDVESAKQVAEQARHQAEDMSTELVAINEDIVRVNSELANNMQMLREAQDALVKKGRMEQMGQLTATIAHELRNPLGAVRTSTFLIERKIKGRELGIESQIARINNGVTRCDDIITQLLDFSRSKKLSCRSENLDKWLEKIVAEEASQLPAVVTIECVFGLENMQVPFDPSRLQRAIINLVSNASEAMVGNGEDASRFSTPTPRITVSTTIEGEFALICVRDNGAGITPENLERIREPLFTTKSFGTGLGLPAVDQIVMQHGGKLLVASQVGEGATFTIMLPLRSVLEDAA